MKSGGTHWEFPPLQKIWTLLRSPMQPQIETRHGGFDLERRGKETELSRLRFYPAFGFYRSFSK